MRGATTLASSRKALIEWLAYETPWARRRAQRGPDPEVARQLGISDDLIEEAATILRGGILPPQKRKAVDSARLDIEVPQMLHVGLVHVAASLDMTRIVLCRSVLHTMMQTTREPTRRAPRSWKTSALARRAEAILVGREDRPVSLIDPIKYVVMVNDGLMGALTRRAAAFRESRSRYVIFWWADLVEGKLADVGFPPALVTELFPLPEQYVLPAPLVDPAGAEK